MLFSNTTPENLAQKAVANMSRNVDFERIPTDGAQKAAQFIRELLDAREKGMNAHEGKKRR